MQTVSDGFHLAAQAGIRPHTWGFWASFPKNIDDSVEFGSWDSSTWDGGDLWTPGDDILFPIWNFYDYYNYSDRVVEMEWTREIDFPYSVSSAIADITLNNYDNFFTPEKGSPIDGFILPKRPIRLYAGLRGHETLQQMVGITQGVPELDTKTKLATFNALDFLSEMFSMPLTETVAMANVRTDEVLAELFQQFGLAPSQYELATGRNKIPFLFFDRGKNAGNAFRDLMQAEGGHLWLDEQGIIRFEQRLLPISDPVMEFNDSNVDEISGSGESELINTVRIRTDLREVQEFQAIWTSYTPDGTSQIVEPIIVPANGTKFFQIDLTDPLLTVSEPTLGQLSDDSWFTALNGETPVNSDVSVSLGDLRNNNYVIMFENDNSFDVTIDKLQVWGEPAKLVDGNGLRYEAYDDVSVTKYGERVLEIDNNMFGSESNAESFAETILDAYAELNGVIEMSVKGDPSLQLGDIVEVDTRDFQGQYKVIKISNSMRDNRAKCTIKARRYEPRSWGFWDVSLWDDGYLWAP